MNIVTLAIIGIVAVSVAAGYAKGASRSAQALGGFVAGGIITALSVYAAWRGAELLSPLAQQWLAAHSPAPHAAEPGALRRLYAALLVMLRDYTLVRVACLFIVLYAAVSQLCWALARAFGWRSAEPDAGGRRTLASGLAGAALGAVLGGARSLLFIAALFVLVALFPSLQMSQYVQQSKLYQSGATQIIAPLSGELVAQRAPVFTRAVEREFNHILQRKYDLIDHHVSEDIAGQAAAATAGLESDEQKARALYDWVGAAIAYDYEKVRKYEEEQLWLEQSPSDTFALRTGVCIDYARLYASMARAVGLDVKVMTGLGYDGRGGYGPHAWNEVYLSEQERWAPLDATWAASGDWFDSPGFQDTHIQSEV